MYIQHLYGLFSHPHAEWNAIKTDKVSGTYSCILNILLMAAIPPIALYIGSTQVGLSVMGGEYTKIEASRAFPLSIAFYFALLAGVAFMSYITFWMEKTFGVDASFERCVTLIGFTATPMFLSGLVGFLPIIWLDILVVLAAVGYTLYLLYIGVPIYMSIPEEKGFIFSSSILTAGLCCLVGIMASSVIIWGSGIIPQLSI